MHQGSVLPPLLLAVMVYVVTELARDGERSLLLYADDLVMMSEIIEGLRNMFLISKYAFWSKDLKVNHGNTKVMVSGGITKNGLSTSNVDPCGVCSLSVKTKSVLCVQCGR